MCFVGKYFTGRDWARLSVRASEA